MAAGYSKKSLVDKLGIKSNFKVAFINPPPDFKKVLGSLPDGVKIKRLRSKQIDFIHFFTKSRKELEKEFPRLKKHLKEEGLLWISWPKVAAKIPTDVNENIAREIGLENGLVDVKVCAVDDIWSGLKFVYRLKDRTSKVSNN